MRGREFQAGGTACAKAPHDRILVHPGEIIDQVTRRWKKRGEGKIWVGITSQMESLDSSLVSLRSHRRVLSRGGSCSDS